MIQTDDLCPNCGDPAHTVVVIDVELTVFNCDYEWRYLRTRNVKHAITHKNNEVHGYETSYCGRGPMMWDYWYGTGNQTEIDKLKKLPECKACVTFLKKSAERRKVPLQPTSETKT